jgi:anti-sigma B factor antagonist
MTQDVTVRYEQNNAILDIQTTHVDFRNAESLKQAVSQLFNPDIAHVIVNLSNVTFMDSSGLSILLVGKRSADEHSSQFSVYGLQGYVKNLVELTHLNRVIPIYVSENEAKCGKSPEAAALVSRIESL